MCVTSVVIVEMRDEIDNLQNTLPPREYRSYRMYRTYIQNFYFVIPSSSIN